MVEMTAVGILVS